MMTVDGYLAPLKIAFAKKADPVKAMYMKKYMKGQYDYFGIASPERREIIAEFKQTNGLIPEAIQQKVIHFCWQAPEREYQYFAMEMLGKTAKKPEIKRLETYEYMITSKSWWDTVDYIASNLVGPYFQKYPERINPVTGTWMGSGNIWLQRTCLLFQLKYKKTLDTVLLENYIMQLIQSKEFFIRKAIGWILREYSKTNPSFVIHFTEKHELSGLSHREALKWIDRKINKF